MKARVFGIASLVSFVLIFVVMGRWVSPSMPGGFGWVHRFNAHTVAGVYLARWYAGLVVRNDYQNLRTQWDDRYLLGDQEDHDISDKAWFYPLSSRTRDWTVTRGSMPPQGKLLLRQWMALPPIPPPPGTCFDYEFKIPTWILAVLLTILPASWLWWRLRVLAALWEMRWWEPPEYCANCRYDVHASRGSCPECGHPIPKRDSMPYGVAAHLIFFGKYIVEFDCPHCGVELETDLNEAGENDRCPKCAYGFQSPGVAIQDVENASRTISARAESDLRT